MNKTKKRDYSRNKSPNYVAEKQISNICINNKRNKQTNKQKPQNNEKKLTCRNCGRCFVCLQSTRLTRKQKKFRSNPNHGFTPLGTVHKKKFSDEGFG